MRGILALLALSIAVLALPWLSGCALNGTQFALGQSDAIACSGKSKVSYGERVSLECDGTLRWTTGGEISSNAVGAVGATRDAALGAAARMVGVPVAK